MISVWIGLGAAFLWVIILTFLFLKLRNHYNTLIEGVNKKTLEGVLTNIVRDLHTAKKDIVNLSNRCDTIDKQQLTNIQKIGLLRFNPFKDTGGDQSFILALLDANDTGVVVTALYSRSGTRWYAKKVVAGKGSEHELSDDERKALKMANEVK
ncbi:DUF4446 family protein [Candidatus Roizmanbacteria bacterium]|nr:DUF4446 family protein [Candidatus Roizmanbacteria bacterium]